MRPFRPLPFLMTALACSSRAVPEPERTVVASDPDQTSLASSSPPPPPTRSAEAAPDAGSAPPVVTKAAEGPRQDARKPAPDAAKPKRVDLHDVCGHMTATPDCLAAIPKVAECPARFEDVPEGDLCGALGITSASPCSYPEGRCACVHDEYCGGVVPTFIQHQGMKWRCRPPPSRDDCPEAMPRAAAKCSPAGKMCHYGGCGHATNCKCSGGRWACETRQWAPPPSAPPPPMGPHG